MKILISCSDHDTLHFLPTEDSFSLKYSVIPDIP